MNVVSPADTQPPGPQIDLQASSLLPRWCAKMNKSELLVPDLEGDEQVFLKDCFPPKWNCLIFWLRLFLFFGLWILVKVLNFRFSPFFHWVFHDGESSEVWKSLLACTAKPYGVLAMQKQHTFVWAKFLQKSMKVPTWPPCGNSTWSFKRNVFFWSFIVDVFCVDFRPLKQVSMPLNQRDSYVISYFLILEVGAWWRLCWASPRKSPFLSFVFFACRQGTCLFDGWLPWWLVFTQSVCR